VVASYCTRGVVAKIRRNQEWLWWNSPTSQSVEAGPDPLVPGAGRLADGADGAALGRGAAVGGGEERGEVGVEVDDAADVVVELPDEADVAGEVAGHLGLVVVVDLVDEEPVLVQQRLHLHEARLERVQHLGVDAGGPRAAAAEPRQRRLAALHGIGRPPLLIGRRRPGNRALLWACQQLRPQSLQWRWGKLVSTNATRKRWWIRRMCGFTCPQRLQF